MGEILNDTPDRDPAWSVSAEVNRRPAICIAASNFELESVVETLIQSKRHGYFTFVTVSESTDPTIAALAEELDAGVIELDGRDVDRSRSVVERIARVLGFPGVLYVTRPGARIDYSRCEDAVETASRFGVHAPTVSEADAAETGVLVAIPAYNEGRTVADVVAAADEHADEVLVVDDGSDDETVAVAERAGATVIEHERNRGYGAALKTAFAEASHRDVDWLVILDGDGQHDPADIPKLLDEREEDADVVIGSRFQDDAELRMPLYRLFGLLIVNVLTNLSLGVVRRRSWVSDTQSGFRAYSREAIRSLAADDGIEDGMEASTDILYHANEHDYVVDEVGTTIRYDGEDTNSQNPLLHGMALVGNVVRTVERERPLTALGLPGVLAVTVGVGFGYWTVANYLQTGTFPAGLALVCLFGTFLGSLLVLVSVVLHSLNSHLDGLSKHRARREL